MWRRADVELTAVSSSSCRGAVGCGLPWDAKEFMLDLAGRITNLARLTTDGLGVYPNAAYETYGTKVDYAQLIKTYAVVPAGDAPCSPPKCNGAKQQHIIGCPDPADVSTSHVEPQNLAMRTGMQRSTR